MAQVTDYLTASEFADEVGIALVPIARDKTRAIGILDDRLGWNLAAGTTYEELTTQQQALVDAEAQTYADARVDVFIDAGVRNVAKVVRRPLVDRLLHGDESIVCIPPTARDGKITLAVRAFLRFADHGQDNVYPFRYYTTADTQAPTGVLDIANLSEVADPIFPDDLRIVTPAAGEWPSDFDTARPCYFSVWIGVKTTDADFPLYRQAVLSAANAFRGDEEGRPYPIQKTIRSILGMVV